MLNTNQDIQSSSKYVLITAAYNEERYIDKLIRSVVSQTVPPKRWVIVSDGSTDRTDEIVASYAKSYSFIELLNIREEHERNFAAQVNAIRAGYEQLKHLEFDFVGNLDADVILEVNYFQLLLGYFARDLRLGLSGGFIYEFDGKKYESRRANSTRSVAHAVQFFRRECYESIGGYIPLRYGGPDWCAEIMARMEGWRVESQSELPVFHQRHTGLGTGLLRYCYQQGFMAYSLGSHPVFEIFKCVSRMRAEPYVLGACAYLGSFFVAHFRAEPRPVSEAFVSFLRQEQMGRLRKWVLHPLRYRDNAQDNKFDSEPRAASQ